MNRIILAALLAAGVAVPAHAQTYQDSGGTVVPGVVPIQPGVGPLFTSANPGKISGSFSASLTGFQPTPSYASLSVGATSNRVALPSGTVVVVYNTGANAAYVTIGGASVTATTSDDFVPAGGWMAFSVGSSTYLAGIETAGASTLNLSGGSGLPTGACCSASGGSGSNASVGATGSAVPSSATLGGMSVGGTMTALLGTSNGLKVDGSAVTQAVSAASLPLPSGAATAANQTSWQGATGSSVPTNAALVGGNLGGVLTALPMTSNGLKVDASAVTLNVANPTVGSSGSSVPSSASYVGANSGGNLVGIIQANASVPINISTATTTQLVPASGSTKIYVTSYGLLAAGTGNLTFEYGTGSNCGTGTTALTGAFNLTAQAGVTQGSGLGPILVVPAGDALCVLTTAAVQMSGSVAFTQF